MGFYLTRDSRDIVLEGDVYPIRDSLRALKFKWDPIKKRWWTTPENWQYVHGAVARLPGYESPKNKELMPGPTPNQIAYARSLLLRTTDSRWIAIRGRVPKPTDDSLEEMTRAEVSRLIGDLRG